MTTKVEVYYSESHHTLGDWFVEIFEQGKRGTKDKCVYCKGKGFLVDKERYKHSCGWCGGRKEVTHPSLKSFSATFKYCKPFAELVCKMEDYVIIKEHTIHD